MSVRERRTSAERSANTRKALLEATIDCLAELGYAGTSTTEIVRRAGVSRGAQVHHFPTKSELVVAAVEHLFQHRSEEFAGLLAEVPMAERDLSKAVTILWSMFEGRIFRAITAVVSEALVDPELGEVVRELWSDYDSRTEQSFAELFPDEGAKPFSRSMLQFTFAVMQAAAIHRELGMRENAEAMVNSLSNFANFIYPVLKIGHPSAGTWPEQEALEV